MSLDQDFYTKAIEGLRGAWTRFDAKRAQPRRASLARNVKFDALGPSTRWGHSQFLAVTGKVTSMYNWVTKASGWADINRLVYFRGGDTLVMYNFPGASSVDLFTLTGRAAIVAEAGNRLYAAVFNTDIQGAGEARVVNALIGGTPSDKAFAAPMADVPVMSENGAGNCSAGAKKFGYILETRTGFSGKYSPSSGLVDYTPTAGDKTIRMTITADTPDDAAYYHPIMTTTENPNRVFFVPGGAVGIPGGAVGWVVNIDISISDDDLARTGVEANDHEDYLTQSGGTGPFSPSAVVELGNRMGYIVDNKLYISDIDDFQVLREAFNVKYLPGKKQIVGAFVQRGVIYTLGPGWTHGFQDNTDYPATWGRPDTISDALGCPGPLAYTTRTAGDFAWVANPSGLYLFQGGFPEYPISYADDPDWQLINWAAPYSVIVVDDVANQCVKVAAPLGSATEPTHVFKWDYSRGLSPWTVDFSLDDYLNGGTNDFSSIAVIQDPTTRRPLYLIGPSASGYILDEDPSQASRGDNSNGIESIYETGQMLNASDRKGKTHIFPGCDLDIRGNGLAELTCYGKDRKIWDKPNPIMLSASPGKEVERRFNVKSENASIRIRTNGVNQWFDLTKVRPYWSRWLG